jgi:hypothetical protein
MLSHSLTTPTVAPRGTHVPRRGQRLDSVAGVAIDGAVAAKVRER